MRRSKKPEPDPAQPAAGIKTVTARALDLLSRREHSARELRYKLVAKGFNTEHVEVALAQLSEQGLLDERRFVESYVYGRVQRGYGPVRIRAELRERGADTGNWADAVDWVELAIAARQKRFGAAAPADYRARAKQMRFLQQRGFTQDQISAAIRQDP